MCCGCIGYEGFLFVVVGLVGFGFWYGEVWVVYLVWSGDMEYFVECLFEGVGLYGVVLVVVELL